VTDADIARRSREREKERRGRVARYNEPELIGTPTGEPAGDRGFIYYGLGRRHGAPPPGTYGINPIFTRALSLSLSRVSLERAASVTNYIRERSRWPRQRAVIGGGGHFRASCEKVTSAPSARPDVAFTRIEASARHVTRRRSLCRRDIFGESRGKTCTCSDVHGFTDSVERRD